MGWVEEDAEHKQCDDTKVNSRPHVGSFGCIYWCIRDWKVIGLYMTACRQIWGEMFDFLGADVVHVRNDTSCCIFHQQAPLVFLAIRNLERSCNEISFLRDDHSSLYQALPCPQSGLPRALARLYPWQSPHPARCLGVKRHPHRAGDRLRESLDMLAESIV